MYRQSTGGTAASHHETAVRESTITHTEYGSIPGPQYGRCRMRQGVFCADMFIAAARITPEQVTARITTIAEHHGSVDNWVVRSSWRRNNRNNEHGEINGTSPRLREMATIVTVILYEIMAKRLHVASLIYATTESPCVECSFFRITTRHHYVISRHTARHLSTRRSPARQWCRHAISRHWMHVGK